MFKYNSDNFISLWENKLICVFDVETTLIEKGASVFLKTPKYVVGEAYFYSNSFKIETHKITTETKYDLLRAIEGSFSTIIVGHNLPFDLKQIDLRNPKFIYWDTSVAEYLLSNQTHLFPSLEKSLINNNLGHLSKDHEVSNLIKEGVCPSTMDLNMLKKYLHTDVCITRALFEKQVEKIRERGTKFLNLVLQQMQWRFNTYIMSTNGVQVDLSGARTEQFSESLRLKWLLESLKDSMQKYFPLNIDVDVTPNSPKQVLTYLCGGEVKTATLIPFGLYKSGPKKGEIKSKTDRGTKYVEGILNVKLPDVSEDSLKDLISSVPLLASSKQFVDYLLEYRKIAKDIKTYYVGYLDKLSDSDRFHPEYRHTVTPTGRISCAYPNLMNLPKH